MDRDELLALYDRGDWHGLARGATRRLIEAEYPGAEYGVLCVHVRDGVPDLMIPVIASASSPSPPPPARRPVSA